MNLTRITSTLGAGAVAGIAAWSSWSHQVHVAHMVGERPEVAYVLPLSVDGLLVVASAAMVDDKRGGRVPRWSARLAFVVGVAATVGANVASAQPTWGARIVAAWPAIALLLVVELLSRRGRKSDVPAPAPEVRTEDQTPPKVNPVDLGEPVVRTPARQRTRQPARKTTGDRLAALLTKQPDITQDKAAQRLGVSTRTVSRHWPRPAPINGAQVDLAPEEVSA